MTYARTVGLAGTSIALVVVACSSGGSSGGSSSGGGITTSVDSSKKVNGLSSSDAAQYCHDVQSFVTTAFASDVQKVFCRLFAASFAGLGAQTEGDARTNCEDSVAKCNDTDAGIATTDADAGADPCIQFNQQLATCDATVAEVNKCYDDSIAGLRSLASVDFCAEVHAGATDAGATTSAYESQLNPASCTSLQQRCPFLSGSDQSGGNGG